MRPSLLSYRVAHSHTSTSALQWVSRVETLKTQRNVQWDRLPARKAASLTMLAILFNGLKRSWLAPQPFVLRSMSDSVPARVPTDHSTSTSHGTLALLSYSVWLAILEDQMRLSLGEIENHFGKVLQEISHAHLSTEHLPPLRAHAVGPCEPASVRIGSRTPGA